MCIWTTTHHNIEPCADHETYALTNNCYQYIDRKEHIESEQFERLACNHIDYKRK